MVQWGLCYGPRRLLFSALLHTCFLTSSHTEMRQYFDRIPADTHILLTHSPPYGILDLAWVAYMKDTQSVEPPHCTLCNATHRHYELSDAVLVSLDLSDSNHRHWGSRCLLDRVRTVKPAVHIFGHVHDGAPSVHIEPGRPTVFLNAAQDLYPKPIVFDVYL